MESKNIFDAFLQLSDEVQQSIVMAIVVTICVVALVVFFTAVVLAIPSTDSIKAKQLDIQKLNCNLRLKPIKSKSK